MHPLTPRALLPNQPINKLRTLLLVAIDGQIDDNLLDIRSCIELEVYQEPHEPVKARATGTTKKEIEDSREHNRILYESKVKKWDQRVDNIEKNAIKVQLLIYDKFMAKSTKDKFGVTI